jgi:hypothetical protein
MIEKHHVALPRRSHARAVIGEREAEVRLADAGSPVDDGERAGEEASPQHLVELGHAGRDPCGHEARFYPARPLVANCRS